MHDTWKTRQLRNYTSTAVLIIASLAIFSLLSGCGGMPDNAAATVDGNVISKDDVATRNSLLTVINFANNTGAFDDYANSIASQAQGVTIPESFVQQEATSQLVAEEIDRLEAEARGISVTDDEIAAMKETILEDNFLGEAQLMEQNLADAGLTQDNLRDLILGRLYHQKIGDALQAEITVTEDEARTQYNANLSIYVYPEKRMIRQVVVADEAAAQAVADRINAGENMTIIARQESIDKITGPVAGRTDLVLKGELPQAVGDMAFSLAHFQVSPPFKSDLGWYVIRVELINTGSNLAFEQVKDEITKALRQMKLDDRLTAYQKAAEASHVVEYAEGYRPGQ
jgi:parvulin-like peptidyl-prolyl isomerase